MLLILGFSMIAVFMYLILSKRLTPMVALILVPLTFAALAGAFGITGQAEEGVIDSIMTALGDFAPTAVLLFFAIIYFRLMIDVGLFDPLIRLILRVVGHDPCGWWCAPRCWPGWSSSHPTAQPVGKTRPRLVDRTRTTAKVPRAPHRPGSGDEPHAQ